MNKINFREFYDFLIKDRLFYVDEVRKWLRQYDNKEISFSKFVELFNEKVFIKYHQGECVERSVATEDQSGNEKPETESPNPSNQSGESETVIEDGFGSYWDKVCPTCQQPTMQVVRPGKVRCSNCQ
jgi:hypothetical protein